eukprot:2088197-Heterocapsa_arctica.AAC.1
MEPAARRLPGFDRDSISRGNRQVGLMGIAPERCEMGGQGPIPGAWRHQPGAVRPEGLLGHREARRRSKR